MASPQPVKRLSAIEKGPKYPSDPLIAMSRFKQGKDPANVSLRRLIRRLVKADIPFAVVGGLAVYAHGHHRMTDDVDVLLTREGFEEFRRRYVPRNYEPAPRRPRRFIDRQNKVTVDILITGLHPGFAPFTGPITFPDPEAVRQEINSIPYIDLPTLIQLKLAARRHQDFGDVVNLISANNLDESYMRHLHSVVHRDYVECLEEKRRQDEYESREE
jgi:hypothetical protein